MASIRARTRRDGTPTWAVLYSLDGRQSSVTFTDADEAEQFRAMATALGARRALNAWGIADTTRSAPERDAVTLADWLEAHIDQLTGCEQKTIDDYRRYARQIGEFFPGLPLSALTGDDVARWVRHLEAAGNSPKTIRNKHGFLSAALARGFQPDAASIGVAATFGLLICDTINNAPSAAGINRIGMALMAEGLSPRQTADAIVLAVDEFCPYHMPVLAAYAGQVSATA